MKCFTCQPQHPAIRLFVLTGLWCALAPWQAAADDSDVLPLPSWPPETAPATSFPLGGPLLPSDPSASGADSHMSIRPAPSDSFLFFIPKGSLVIKPTLAPAAAPIPLPLVDVGADFLARCESQDPDDRLYDPGRVLPETSAKTLRRLLAYHAEEAATTASFLLLDENQKLPAGSDLARLGAGRLLQGHHCLAVYPLGQPGRARLFMSREITSSLPRDYLKALVRACVDDALQATEPVEQLQRFATLLSIRIIWMERAYPALFTAAENSAPPPPPAPGPVRAIPSAELLAEVTHPAPTETAAPLRRILPAAWQPYLMQAVPGLVAAVLLLLTVFLLYRIRRRRMRQLVWMLPEPDYQTRLGGSHCGGGGAWIHYR